MHLRCLKTCKICGVQCRALEGEECAFFCQHHIKSEPPKDLNSLVYLFHPKRGKNKRSHWLPLEMTKKAIRAQLYQIMNIADQENAQDIQTLPIVHVGNVKKRFTNQTL